MPSKSRPPKSRPPQPPRTAIKTVPAADLKPATAPRLRQITLGESVRIVRGSRRV